MRFENNIVIVTGGSRGIGRAIVDKFKHEGAIVVTCGRGPRPDDLPSDVSWVQGNVARAQDCEEIVEIARSIKGRIDILVNNAGVQVEKNVAQSTDKDWDLVIGANCKGVFSMARAVINVMGERGGNIINIGSISAERADPAMALYNASKAFVHGLTRSIAVDHGPQIRCNAVCPGWIMTGMADAAFAAASNPDLARKDAIARHASRRFGEPVDIANMVLWLASNEATFITGQCFTVDGGLTAASPLQPGLF